MVRHTECREMKNDLLDAVRPWRYALVQFLVVVLIPKTTYTQQEPVLREQRGRVQRGQPPVLQLFYPHS